MMAKPECSSIAFLAVARVVDNAKLTICFDNGVSKAEKKQFERAMQTLQTRAANLMYPGWKDRCLLDEECGAAGGVVWARVDDQGICLMSVGLRGEKQVSERLVVQLLRALTVTVKSAVGDDKLIEALPGTLTATLRKPMLDIMKSYKDPATKDKLTEVQEEVDIAKVKMQDNIQTIIESFTTLEHLQVQSQSMSQRADDFCKQSGALKRQIRLRNLKVKALTVGCVGAISLYFLLPFIQG